MKETDLASVFEICVQRLSNGEPLDAILKDYPSEAARIRPLLETTLVLHQYRPAPASVHSQNAARASFLAAVGDRQPARLHPGHRLRTILVTATVLLVMVGTLLGTGLTSAMALPGDTLYPVKRAVEQTRLALTTSTLDQLKLEESFDERRKAEAVALVENQRSEAVTFYGILEPVPGGGWKVGSLTIYSRDPNADWSAFSGAYVEVTGNTTPHGIEAEVVRLRTFHLEGTLETISPSEWLVSGTPVEITPTTQINDAANPGDRLSIEAIQKSGRRFTALTINSGGTTQTIS